MAYEPVGRGGRFEGVDVSGSTSGAFDVLMVVVGALSCGLVEVATHQLDSTLTLLLPSPGL